MTQELIVAKERVDQLLTDFRIAKGGAIESVLKMATVILAADNEVPQVKDEFYKKLGVDGISETTISKYRSIGNTASLYSKPQVLPLDKEILYEMRNIDQDMFDGGVATGIICPEMKRGDWKNRNKEVAVQDDPIEDTAASTVRKFIKYVDEVGINQLLTSTKYRPEEVIEIQSTLRDIAEELSDED